MLALDDGALARLCIGATGVAPHQRNRWLQRVAKELEGHRPSPTARRLRKFQARRHHGQACYRVVQDCVDLEELLLAAGGLSPQDRDNHAAVEQALGRFLALCVLDHRNAFQPGRGIYDTVRAELGLTALQKALPHVSKKRFRK